MTDVPVTDVRTAFHRQCPRCCFAECWKVLPVLPQSDFAKYWKLLPPPDESGATMIVSEATTIVEYTCPMCGLVFAQQEAIDDGEAPDDGQAEDLAAPPIEAPEGGDDA